MIKQQVEQGRAAENTPERGISMFKDHIAAMKSGSWRLGGDRESGSGVTEQDPDEAEGV